MAEKLDSSGVLGKEEQERIRGSTDIANSNSEDSEGGIVDGINERSLLRKLDRNLLPAVGILYLLSFLDRSNGKVHGDAYR
jgi:hypothetical protein